MGGLTTIWSALAFHVDSADGFFFSLHNFVHRSDTKGAGYIHILYAVENIERASNLRRALG